MFADPDRAADFVRDRGPQGRATSEQVTPHDPNNIVGPSGFGADVVADLSAQPERFEGFVNTDINFNYTIQFENKPDAAAPAQVVFVSQQLDTDLDFSTFELGDFGFGNFTVHIPAGRAVPTAPSSTPPPRSASLSISAPINLDPASPTSVLATWTLASLDPTTVDLPLDPFAGFLPANITPPEGDGFVNYTVEPKSGLASGTHHRRPGHDLLRYRTTRSTRLSSTTSSTRSRPSSAITPFPTANTVRGTFRVGLTGADKPPAPASRPSPSSPRQRRRTANFLLGSTDLAGRFTGGESGHTYEFFTIAIDDAGNAEASRHPRCHDQRHRTTNSHTVDKKNHPDH